MNGEDDLEISFDKDLIKTIEEIEIDENRDLNISRGDYSKQHNRYGTWTGRRMSTVPEKSNEVSRSSTTDKRLSGCLSPAFQSHKGFVFPKT